MASYSFSETVATRTRAASHILNTPELLQAFLDLGGLEADLTAIIQSGLDAERANESQSRGLALDMAATADAQAAFGALQREYKLVMAVARAVLEDLIDAGASQDTLEAMRRVLADETAVHIKTVKGEGCQRRPKNAVERRVARDVAIVAGEQRLP